MHTSIAIFTLMLGMSSTRTLETPNWLNDYREAQVSIAKIGKPMAVFFGSGKAGWEKVVREGSLDSSTSKLLAQKYICVYVDTSTDVGRSWASAFEVYGRGLVISDSKGTRQAYSLAGDLTKDELKTTLEKYADPEKSVKTTETVVREAAPRATSPSYPANSSARMYRQQYTTTPTYASGGT